MATFKLDEYPIDLWDGDPAIQPSCDDPQFQIYLAGIHAITPQEFALAVVQFTYPVLAPKVLPSAHVYQDIDESCDGNIVTIDYKEKDNTSNADIDFSVTPSAVANYSIALFRGLRRLFPVAEFEFFKAIRKPAPGKTIADDVIFRIIVEETQGNKKVVYLGDYSDLRP
jgi:hypothetical protein